ncbi:fibronectin type III domain-containing protein [Fibrella aquatilis]|uniref:Fibronectin type III domain-containing protein n=1 Tax=Fibrella aquatilis TaxID=2817059 RepID=A0A939JYR7_9BACT|nr:fibronectin type III domain-containing protein [Fibrella aquatilis]MBO0929425.1 fibronectin type III domain-containing protein [Fibrella aquatilis]
MNRIRTLLALTYLLMLIISSSGTLWAQSNAPTSLTVNVTYGGSICLQWKPNITAATVYEVERSTNGRSGSFSKVGESAAVAGGTLAVGNYCDENLLSNTTYYYQVRGKTGSTFTGYSNTASGTTKGSPPTPAAPTLSEITASTIRATWNTQLSTTYELEMQSAGGSWRLINTQASGRNASLTFKSDGLTGGTNYCFRVRAKDPQAGTSGYSPNACQTTPLLPTNIKNFGANANGSTNSIKLTWTGYGKESGITIERRTGQNGAWDKSINTLADGGEFTDTGLPSGTEYCYRIQESGHEASETKCATTAQLVASPPTNLKATPVSTSRMDLSWTASTSTFGTGYLVEARQQGGNYSQIADLNGITTTTFSHTGLAANTQYCYRVRTKYNTPSDYCPEVCNTTQTPAPTAPAKPTNLQAKAQSSTEIKLTWTDNSTNETRFELQRSPIGNDPWENVDNNIGPNTQEKTDGGRNPSTRYYYRIRAVLVLATATLNSDWSDVANDITQAPPVTAPSAPSGLVITALSSTEIKLAWTDNSTNESGFEIEQSDTQTSTFTNIKTTGADTKEFIVSGLQPSRNYCFQVRAINGAGKSAYAGPACATTQPPPITTPAAPTAFVTTAASTSVVNLSWMDKSDNETGFELQWNTTGNDPWTSLPTQTSNVTTFVHTGLTANTRYYYRLRAVNSAKQSDWVTTNTLTPNLPVPSTSVDLKAQLADYDRVLLIWGPIGNGPTSILVERSTSPTSGFASVTQLAGTATQYTDKDLAEKTTYYYRIRAVNMYGPSGNSNVETVTTPETIIAVRRQPLPEGVTAYVTNQTLMLTLNWSYFQETTLHLVSMTGRDLLTDQCRSNGGTQFQYDVAHLPTGIYILSLDTATTRYTKKLWIP